MKIGIVGGGAIGLLFSTYLTKAGHDVTVFVRRENQRKLIADEGILLRAEREETYYPNVLLWPNQISHFELLIFTVKQYHLENLLPILKKMDQHTPLLFIQNGMGHLHFLDELPSQQIFIGIVEHGATKKTDRTVLHKGFGTTKIGVYRGNPTLLRELRNRTTSYFPFELVEDWLIMLHEKLLINHVINPLTALYQIKNGELIANAYFLNAMEQLYKEALLVIDVPNSTQLWDRIKAVCENTKDNQSSMFQDIIVGRKTEIDAISGYILNQFQEHSKECPLTTFVVTSIHGLEKKEGEK